jgi:hypothetical protein
MRINSLSLPHPVLGLSDDVEGAYDVKLNVQLGREEIVLNLEHLLKNNSIKSLIEQKKAIFCVEINCPKTFYRNTYLNGLESQEIKIPSHLLRDKVECDFFITACVNISDYSIAESNSDYDGVLFYIENGDVLATGGHTSFLAEKEWQAYKAVSNFMEIIQDQDREEGPIKIDLSSEKIVIHMPKNDYARYNKIRKAPDFEATFHASLVLPTLIYALTQMVGQHRETYSGFKWFDILDYRKSNDENLKHLNWSDPTVIPELAQRLVENPLKRSMESIENILDNG